MTKEMINAGPQPFAFVAVVAGGQPAVSLPAAGPRAARPNEKGFAARNRFERTSCPSTSQAVYSSSGEAGIVPALESVRHPCRRRPAAAPQLAFRSLRPAASMPLPPPPPLPALLQEGRLPAFNLAAASSSTANRLSSTTAKTTHQPLVAPSDSEF